MTTVLLAIKYTFAVSAHMLCVVQKCLLGCAFAENNRKNQAHNERQTRSEIIPTMYDKHNTLFLISLAFHYGNAHPYFASLFTRICTCLATS